MNIIVLTRGRVDASPEHLRPGFDGGTGVRTGPTLCIDVSTQRHRSRILGGMTSPTKARGREFI